MPIIKIAIYATEVVCASLVEVKAGITIHMAREELNVQIAVKRENAEHATEQARFLGQLNGIEFVKVLQNKIGGANNSAGFHLWRRIWKRRGRLPFSCFAWIFAKNCNFAG